ncbi:MAG: hypothetical protein BWX79_02451 [Alphaproteobacteria bacterium ADurb.Bin100]|nr:MAG: hypothetical protein BWX79_02451 [Alphaproteobacteria bacterium ADurb.Bin100]
MHVHVDPRRVHLDVERIHRLALAVQHVLVGAARRVGQHLVAHEAPVDVGELLVGAGAGHVRQAGAAAHAHCAHAVVHGDGLRQKILAQHIGQAPFQRGGAPLLDQLALVPDGKTHVGPRQRVTAHRLDAVRQLGGVGLEELAARWGGIEQFLHLDRGAGAARGRAQLAGAPVQQVRAGVAGHARQQGQFRHRIDGRQRFAAKAHGAHGFEVVQAGDLAGCVAFDRGGQLLARNARAIVFHRDQPHAAGQQAQRDLRGTGVQGVVQQLAHHGGRALHHLAGGNLADEFVGQFADRAPRGRG